jgi:hypothetical protein
LESSRTESTPKLLYDEATTKPDHFNTAQPHEAPDHRAYG